MADVTTAIAAYWAAAPTWTLIRDAVAGEAAVKAAGSAYLPVLNPTDKSPQNKSRNEDYVKRSVFYNASGRTVEGLLGLAFQKEPKIEIATSMEDVTANIDGAGQTLEQQMHSTLGQVLETGRAGLLADFPSTEGQVSIAVVRDANIRPTITYYDALSIINWRSVVVGGKARLSLVVLKEQHAKYDGFGEILEPQYRVLELLGGVYRVQIWRKVKLVGGGEEWQAVETYFPKGGDGGNLNEIPFTFVGSRNNGLSINKAPMVDIATLNMAHYRNSADYEDSAFFCGQPTFWIAGLDVQWRDHLEKKGVYVGARQVLPLPVNGSAGIMQAEPNTLAKEAMDQKEKQLAALGARLIQADKSLKTATQQQSEDAVANSVLGLCVENVSAAYTQALQWACMFAKEDSKVVITISKDFTQFTIDPTELSALVQAAQAGMIPMSDFWRRMRAANVIDPTKSDDDVREEIDQNPPPGLTDDDATDPPDNA